METFDILENWSLRRGGRLREVVATEGSTVSAILVQVVTVNLSFPIFLVSFGSKVLDFGGSFLSGSVTNHGILSKISEDLYILSRLLTTNIDI